MKHLVAGMIVVVRIFERQLLQWYCRFCIMVHSSHGLVNEQCTGSQLFTLLSVSNA